MPDSTLTWSPSASPTPQPTRSPMVFSNFYSLVGEGSCTDHINRLYPYVTGFIFPLVTNDEVCGGWCAQHITNSFVGYEQLGNHTNTICRCLFSADGYPSPIPPYVSPTDNHDFSIRPNNTLHQGIGPVSTLIPGPYHHKCFRYIVRFAIHQVCTH